MSTSPPPDEAQRESISLSRLATIFAVTFAIAFGLCAVSAMTVVGDHQKVGAGLIWISVVTEGVCLVGLLAIGIVTIFRAIRDK
jgi:hypothetical protein